MLFTRFAPSPTGFLHQGHLLSALYVFAFAEIFNAKVRLRIEDHDKSRAREIYIQSIREDLSRFGFSFYSESIQSKRNAIYEKYFNDLKSKNLIYPCSCSRKELAFQNPKNKEGEIIYQGKCLKNPPHDLKNVAYRIQLPNKTVTWKDFRFGTTEEIPKEQCGDFIILDKDKQWTYQFAVTADDFEENISFIVRGEDLYFSSARQILLAEILGRKTKPEFFHHPLLYEPNGIKLSKREHSESLRALLEQGNFCESILGAVCHQAKIIEENKEISLNDAISETKKQIQKYLH